MVEDSRESVLSLKKDERTKANTIVRLCLCHYAMFAFMASFSSINAAYLLLVNFLWLWITRKNNQDNYGKRTTKVIIFLWIMNPLNGLKYPSMHMGWVETQSDGKRLDGIYLKLFIHFMGGWQREAVVVHRLSFVAGDPDGGGGRERKKVGLLLLIAIVKFLNELIIAC